MRKNRGLKIFSCLFLNSSELDFLLRVKTKSWIEGSGRNFVAPFAIHFLKTVSLKLKTVWLSINSISIGLPTLVYLSNNAGNDQKANLTHKIYLITFFSLNFRWTAFHYRSIKLLIHRSGRYFPAHQTADDQRKWRSDDVASKLKDLSPFTELAAFKLGLLDLWITKSSTEFKLSILLDLDYNIILRLSLQSHAHP